MIETDLHKCVLCPNECGADRYIRAGKCLATDKITVARADLHFFEEPCVSGKNGSGTVFFSGCSMSCVFCQNHSISARLKGRDVTVCGLAEIFEDLEGRGAHNINLVTPTHYAVQIIEALKLRKPSVPVIYNTSGYEKREVITLLKDYIDVYLTDFKYALSATAKELSGRFDYPATAAAAVREMIDTKGVPVYDSDGMIRSGVIIRHLVVPSYIADSIKVLELIAERFKDKALISIMSQYTPLKELNLPDKINRPLTPLEYKIVIKKARELNLDGYIQELDSSGTAYIPEF
ncbi:MAG: radical SAM protein [Clostridiales bacterium]|nr:radical SAM protein [Clostridiales bacterium]